MALLCHCLSRQERLQSSQGRNVQRFRSARGEGRLLMRRELHSSSPVPTNVHVSLFSSRRKENASLPASVRRKEDVAH